MAIDLHEQPTTYRNDYRYPDLPKKYRRLTHSIYPERIAKARPTPILRDHETLQKNRCTAKLPFDIFFSDPKDIVNTNPRDLIDFPEEISFPLPPKERRVRNSISPAVSFEEAEDLLGLETRELLKDYTYSTTQSKAYETKVPIIDRYIPKSTFEPIPNPIKYDRCPYLPIPLGWKQAAKTWDELQARILGDPTKKFWEQHAPLVRMNTMTDWKAGTVSEETLNKVQELSLEGRLRHPHEMMLGWTGYKPRFSSSISLEKTKP